MVVSYSQDFQVAWEDPDFANVTWIHDGVHFPSPSPPFTQHINTVVLRDLMNSHLVHVNGYAFGRDYNIPPPDPEIMARGPKLVWANEFLPSVQETSARQQSRDYDAMTAAELFANLDDYVREMCAAFRLTIDIMLGFILPTVELVHFCEQELGPEGPALATTLLQGFKNETSQAGLDLAELAELAATLPAVAEKLRGGDYNRIGEVEGGGVFMDRFGVFMSVYGGRAESWPQMEVPTWNEEPEKPLSLVARYLVDPSTSPRIAMERAGVMREEAAAAIYSKLSGEKLEHFNRVMDNARGHVAISEERARWQLIICANLRLPIMAAARKLVAIGVIDEPNDIFYLTFDEAVESLNNPGISLRDRVANGKAEFAFNKTLHPPPFIGAPPDMSHLPPGMDAFMNYFFGAAPPQVSQNVITGRAAGGGQVRGRARVIRQLQDGSKLEKGDILVCQTTSPPWTPLFAIAGGVVTDTGGILSHSAICAREYGLPCVVGTQVATAMITDGAIITVNGMTGKVTIEG